MSDRIDSTGELCEADFALLLRVHSTKIKTDQIREKIPSFALIRFLDLVSAGYITDSDPVVRLTGKGERAFNEWSYVQKWKDRKSYKQGFVTGLLSGFAASGLIWIFSAALQMLTR